MAGSWLIDGKAAWSTDGSADSQIANRMNSWSESFIADSAYCSTDGFMWFGC